MAGTWQALGSDTWLTEESPAHRLRLHTVSSLRSCASAPALLLYLYLAPWSMYTQAFPPSSPRRRRPTSPSMCVVSDLSTESSQDEYEALLAPFLSSDLDMGSDSLFFVPWVMFAPEPNCRFLAVCLGAKSIQKRGSVRHNTEPKGRPDAH